MHKHILITGSAKRIGASIAMHLAQNSSNQIYVTYRNSEVEALKLKERFRNINIMKLDLEKLNEFNLPEKLDVLINNASNLDKNTFLNISDADFNISLTTNGKSPITLANYFLRHNPHGQVINMLDAHLIQKFYHHHFSYSLGKLMLTNYTKSFVGTEFQVFGLALGATLIGENDHPPTFEKVRQICTNSIEDICQALDFILSNKCKNGEVIDLPNWIKRGS
jgi:NAD(P)-dependent dehydrogenase (short-subunit alcohol dehydrogenase family)